MWHSACTAHARRTVHVVQCMQYSACAVHLPLRTVARQPPPRACQARRHSARLLGRYAACAMRDARDMSGKPTRAHPTPTYTRTSHPPPHPHLHSGLCLIPALTPKPAARAGFPRRAHVARGEETCPLRRPCAAAATRTQLGWDCDTRHCRLRVERRRLGHLRSRPHGRTAASHWALRGSSWLAPSQQRRVGSRERQLREARADSELWHRQGGPSPT